MILSQVAIPPLWVWLLFCYLYVGIPFAAFMALRAWRVSRKQQAVRNTSLCAPQNIFYVSLLNAAVFAILVSHAPDLQRQSGFCLFYAVCLLVAVLFSALAC